MKLMMNSDRIKFVAARLDPKSIDAERFGLLRGVGPNV